MLSDRIPDCQGRTTRIPPPMASAATAAAAVTADAEKQHSPVTKDRELLVMLIGVCSSANDFLRAWCIEV